MRVREESSMDSHKTREVLEVVVLGTSSKPEST